MTEHVAGLVLAAGSSRRLGQPKQLLPFKGRTLLDATLDVARDAPFAQRLVTIGGAAEQVRDGVDFDGFQTVDSLHYTDGCSSSIVAALGAINDDVDGIVLLLGDQPAVTVETIATLIDAAIETDRLETERTDPARSSKDAGSQGPRRPIVDNPRCSLAPLAVCRYDDGIGHPFWFAREVFDDLANLHGDKAVWKLIESGSYPVHEVPIAGDVPLDVDTWEDYEQLLAQHGQPFERSKAKQQ